MRERSREGMWEIREGWKRGGDREGIWKGGRE